MAKKKLTNPVMTPGWYASLLDTCVVPVEPPVESTAPPPYVHDVPEGHGGGGMSLHGIELMDMHTRSEDLLFEGLVTVEEVKELADALHRLARKWTKQPPSPADMLARKCSRCGAYKATPESKCQECGE